MYEKYRTCQAAGQLIDLFLKPAYFRDVAVATLEMPHVSRSTCQISISVVGSSQSTTHSLDKDDMVDKASTYAASMHKSLACINTSILTSRCKRPLTNGLRLTQFLCPNLMFVQSTSPGLPSRLSLSSALPQRRS